MQEITWSVMISATAAATAPGSGWSPGCSSTALFPLMYRRPIYQLTKGTIYVSEEMARPIEPMDLIAF